MRLFLSWIVRRDALINLLVFGMMIFGMMKSDVFFHIEMNVFLLLPRFLNFLLCFWRAMKWFHHQGIGSKSLLCLFSILIKIIVIKASGALNTLREDQGIQVFFGLIENFLRVNTRLWGYFFVSTGQRVWIDRLMRLVGHFGIRG